MNARRITILSLLALGLVTPRSPAVGPLQFFSITPCRLYDTRTMNPPRLANGVTRNIQVRNKCGIPPGPTLPFPRAVALNATIVLPTATGWSAPRFS
jgi:hypothetical protein